MSVLILQSKITIIQQPVSDWQGRNKTYTFDFLNNVEGSDSWGDLTNTAKITFPKNIYFRDENGNTVSLQGKNIVSGENTAPILLRGDRIVIELGYRYQDASGKEQSILVERFRGFISKIINKLPITLELEDNMFKLKQIQAPNKLFKSSQYTLQQIITELLNGSGFTVKSDIKTSVGDFRTQNETVAQVLNRIQKDYRIESFFTGDVLTCSGLVYYPEGRKEIIFQFQQNIIDDNLEYRRKDDIKVGIKAYSIDEFELTETTADGKKKTKKKRLETSVGATDGEIRTLYFWNVKSVSDLTAQAKARLNRIFFEGFVGSFTTFGLPFVKQGDAVILRDAILTERNGTYLVKKVDWEFGLSGYRQTVHLDIRIDTLSQSEVNAGL